MNTPRGLPIRPAVRALVLDPSDNVLLVRLVFPHGAWWVLPGGGIEVGENPLDALRRELAEEVGLVDPLLGGRVWSRTHVFAMNDEWDGQCEDVFFVRSDPFTPAPRLSEEELRAESLHEVRWWHLDEIAAYDGDDHFSPADLHERISRIAVHGVPAVPDVIVQDGTRII